jgi:hypothetical protein
MLRTHELPVVGSWYWDVDHSLQFEIVASDSDGAIEIQYFEGELEELDTETWFSMNVVSISAPNDWSGPYEIDKDEFTDFTDDHAQDPNSDLANPIDSLD